MATVVPFKAIRPSKDKVHLVTSRPVNNYSHSELKEKLDTNPFSFLHIIFPDYHDTSQRTKQGTPERLRKIKSRYVKFISEQVLITEEHPCYYIYRQVKPDCAFTGIIGCSSIDDYFNGVIKIHEQTITTREDKLKSYLDVVDYNAEPILMFYPDNSNLNQLVTGITQADPVYDFSTADRNRHQLWIVNKQDGIKIIEEEFEKTGAIYIADGHHRTASSAIYGKAMRERNPNCTGKEPFNFFLCIYFPESQLKIYDYNRVVKDLNGLSTEQFLKKVSEKFIVQEKGKEIYTPAALHNFSFYTEGDWYSLTAKKDIYNDKDPVGILDSAILTNHLLSPILGISDLKTDSRIAFVNGLKGLTEMKNQVDSGKAKAGIALYPATMQQVKNIADCGKSMPPKTTWVEPKMRNGLVIYSLS